MTPALEPVTAWRIGRRYCAACQRVYAVVQHPDAEVTCPRCDGPVTVAHGLDDLRGEDEP